MGKKNVPNAIPIVGPCPPKLGANVPTAPTYQRHSQNAERTKIHTPCGAWGGQETVQEAQKKQALGPNIVIFFLYFPIVVVVVVVVVVSSSISSSHDGNQGQRP